MFFTVRLVPSLAYFDTPRDALSSKTVCAGWVAGSPQLDFAELPEALPVARGFEPLRSRLLMSKRTASAIFMCTTGQRRTFSVGNIVGDFSIFFGKEKSKKNTSMWMDGWN